MEEPDSQTQQRNQRSLWIGVGKLANSVEVVTILTAAGFIVGRAYFEGYYGRLTVPHLAHKIDTGTTLIASLLPVLTYAAVLYWSLTNSTKKPVTILEAFRGNLFVFAFGFGYGFWLYQQFGLLMSIIGSGSLLFVYVLASLLKSSLAHMWHKSIAWKAVVVLIGLFGGVMTANAIGDLHGTNLIRGMPGATEIKLTLKDGTAFLPNRELVFIALSDEQYYFVERAVLPPVNPRIYAVNSDEVKVIELNGRRLR